MEIKRITISNFLSFEFAQYEFKQSQAIPIQGINNSEDDKESNGSGKTAFQNAIEYSLIGSTSRGNIRDIKLIRRRTNEAKLSLELYCPQRKQELVIDRIITKKGAKLELSINDIEVEFASINDGNSLILEWLEISRNDLLNYYIINKYKYESFFSASNTRKLDLISRFSNMSFLDKIEPKIKIDILNIEEKIQLIQQKKSSLNGKIEILLNEIDKEKSVDIKEEKRQRIEKINLQIEAINVRIQHYKDKIESNKSLINKKETELNNIYHYISEVNKELENFSTKDFENLYLKVDSKLTNKNKDKEEVFAGVRDIDEMTNKLTYEISSITNKLAGVIECPNCHHKFILKDKETNVEELEIKINDLKLDLSYVKSEKANFEKHLKEIQQQIDKLRLQRQEITKEERQYQQELRRLQSKINEAKQQELYLKNSLNVLKQEIETDESLILSKEREIETNNELLKKVNELSINTEKIKEFEAQVFRFEKQLQSWQKNEDDAEANKFELNQWIFHFKKFKQHLANKSLRIIQDYANKYLQTFKSDTQIKLEGFKTKADGSIKENITPIIIDEGEECDYKEFSGGEKARLEFAIILSLQEILNSTNPYGGLNLLWTDEVTESLDKLGVELIMNSLNNTHKTILMTTHVGELIDNALIIQKDYKISNLKNN